ncbi:MAG: hypothetical protein APG12_01165 [Candidatus Methanofastidiosum methylothiophilum]|uniref:Spore protein YkvP/CgeB glycosyl transferase-like domain-containing protein n=1 Tax=Candidatus Methanofastidiosum methylothiophilum TaxID=1705564 RepID=A0A150IKB6_9EURY|nr:MAG: hypothetical protein APG10_00893 [Candidatus Methanofastidiosum methylthiophilus]KYC48474.1 MAG: hypothetical protein APG11_00281 [Candidatus Methanofastidiosum methylthiophilus]KYC49916.1 MAG: hypothetical protein APG12_01165 [Candidatus Methanofastidiosum methylthiophilus]
MKILIGYPYSNYEEEKKEQYLKILKKAGLKVDGFCLTLDPPNRNLTWKELDAKWRRGDKKLLSMYKELIKELDGYDVLLNSVGINLHPEFVSKLPVFSVFGCFDDPEASELLSKPVAWAYDLCMVGNIAEVDSYYSWGAKEARYWPIGFKEEDYDPGLSEKKILNGKRDIDISLICDYNYIRKERLDRFSSAFPNGAYYGKGWPNGYIPHNLKVPLYQRTKIGINFHLSTGPINSRTFTVPANGAMLICDNKSYLGNIFKLNKEAVGFETVEEAIELCQYYLENDKDRRKIALAGWKRTLKEYNQIEVFKIMIKYTKGIMSKVEKNDHNIIEFINDKKINRFSSLYEILEKSDRNINRIKGKIKKLI